MSKLGLGQIKFGVESIFSKGPRSTFSEGPGPSPGAHYKVHPIPLVYSRKAFIRDRFVYMRETKKVAFTKLMHYSYYEF